MNEPHLPYASPRAFEAALTARFHRLAETGPHNVTQLRRQFAYDRLLARCFTSDPRWVLKGGVSVLARIPDARHSADVDLAAADTAPETALEALRHCAGLELGDFFAFTLDSPTALIQAAPGLRVPVNAQLGRRPYERFHVDLVSGPPLAGPHEHASPLVSVDIPGLVRPHYRVYPLAGIVADKICAITEHHGEHPSTRFRDLVDLTLIARNQTLDAEATRGALATELLRRRLAPITEIEVPDHEIWSAGYAKTVRTAPTLHGRIDFEQALSIVKRFIDPVLSGAITSGQWNPATTTWDR